MNNTEISDLKLISIFIKDEYRINRHILKYGMKSTFEWSLRVGCFMEWFWSEDLECPHLNAIRKIVLDFTYYLLKENISYICSQTNNNIFHERISSLLCFKQHASLDMIDN